MRVIRPTTAAAAVASLLLHCSPPHPRAPPPRLTDADEIRIVCVSDTHGFEGQLPPVPPGDLLIHCGDFAPDGGSSVRLRAVEEFDQWLAAQPHKVKLVVRGNHDPRSATFPASGATYICKPTSVRVGSLVVHSVPFTRGRLREPIPPCDVLATHSPPKGVLDLCYSGGHGGCRFLRSAVEDAIVRPRLWLCGHIHEGRGHLSDAFGGFRRVPAPGESFGLGVLVPDGDALELHAGPGSRAHGTLVVNCANANTGRATRLEHGAALIRYNPAAAAEEEEAEALTGDAPPREQTLLAIDLGLKSGAALYDGRGALLRYTSFQLQSAAELRAEATQMLRGSSSLLEGEGRAVTHLVIEGGDIELRRQWQEAVEQEVAARSQQIAGDGGRLQEAEAEESAEAEEAEEAVSAGRGRGGDVDKLRVMVVEPRAWRRALLTPKERKSGQLAKAAARLIARQLVAECSAQAGARHEGAFNTDAAEAVLLGFFAVLELGWVRRSPPVRRYQNGDIVVPKKAPAAPKKRF